MYLLRNSFVRLVILSLVVIVLASIYTSTTVPKTVSWKHLCTTPTIERGPVPSLKCIEAESHFSKRPVLISEPRYTLVTRHPDTLLCNALQSDGVKYQGMPVFVDACAKVKWF